MDAWEGQKLNRTNGRSKERISAAMEEGVLNLMSKRGRNRLSPALKKINGAELDGEVTDPDEDVDEAEARPDDRDSSSDSSESSNSSSSSSSSSSSGGSGSHVRVGSLMGMDGADAANLWELDEHGEFIVITCAENEAKLYRERFGRGSIGKSVLFRSRWLTPNEFQAVSGRQSSKDWKRSIRLKGRCLKEYINDGLFKEHEKSCMCKVCLGGDTELLRQEGVIALAAKRRRLSQADGGNSVAIVGGTSVLASVQSNSNSVYASTSSSAAACADVATPTNVVDNVATPTAGAASMASPTEGTSERKLPGSSGQMRTKRKRKSGPRGNRKSKRVWSPSGELAQEMEHQEGDGGSSNEEEENDYKPLRLVPVESNASNKSSIIDASDFLPRRSKRSTHRKHTGHRTELGTYTRKPSEWDAEEVAEFLRLQGFLDYADTFQEYEIDGQSMFLLKEHHLLERFKMKLGPALRLLDTISRLRHPPA